MNLPQTNARREAAFILALWKEQGSFPNRLLPHSPDRGFIMDLLYTTLRHMNTCEWLTKQCVKKMPSGDLWALLMIGCAQIYFMPSIPEHACVYETVTAATQINRSAAGFINATLRTLIRRKAELTTALLQKPLHLQLGYPAPLFKRWAARWGEAKARSICQASNVPAYTVIRPLPPYQAPSICTPHPADPLGSFILPRGIDITQLDGFKEGYFVAQDAATRMAIELLQLDDPSIRRVWDACAAPGGKTAHIAARLRQCDAFILATDQHADRLVTLNDTLARCQFTKSVTVALVDAKDPASCTGECFNDTFDRILVDVPCTNSGVLARRADARWRWTPKRLAQRVEDQKCILENALLHLAPGGKLVYSTCSIEEEENEAQIALCLERHPNLICEDMRTITPDEGCDGAFAACLTHR